MTVGDFEAKNAQRWEEYERLVEALEKGKPNQHADQLPRRFRELCVDLSLAQCRMYGGRLTERLNALVIRGYEIIYRTRRGTWQGVIAFFTTEFPRAVRADWKLFWLCSAMFWLPFFAMMFSVHHDPTWVQAALGAEGMASMDLMYGAGEEQQIAHHFWAGHRQEFPPLHRWPAVLHLWHRSRQSHGDRTLPAPRRSGCRNGGHLHQGCFASGHRRTTTDRRSATSGGAFRG